MAGMEPLQPVNMARLPHEPLFDLVPSSELLSDDSNMTDYDPSPGPIRLPRPSPQLKAITTTSRLLEDRLIIPARLSSSTRRRSRTDSPDQQYDQEQDRRRPRLNYEQPSSTSSSTASTTTPVGQALHPLPSTIPPPTSVHTTIDPPSTSASHAIHPDALAVDHPLRSYDVAEFLHTWRSARLSHEPNILPPIDPLEETISLTHLEHTSRNITRSDLANEKLDLQGIYWKDLGTTRDSAIRARALFHPLSSVSRPSLSTSIRHYDRYYRFRCFHSQHRAQFFHYQLRNILAATSRNDVFYAAGNKVTSTALATPNLKTTVMDLSRFGNTSPESFRITCLATSPASSSASSNSERVLFAGGFRGEYAMLDLNADETTPPVEGYVTHAQDGVITHISTYYHYRSGQLKAAFCSNDASLRIMDVSTLRFTHHFSYYCSVNAAAISPDGRLRALVGDSCDAFITDAESGKILVNLSSHTDHGFACAWAPDGVRVATGAEDGKVTLWDARNWSRPYATLDCLMSCPRSLNFANDGTLVIAEDYDVLSFYDSKRDRKQDVTFFGSVAGVSLLDGGNEVVVANADKSVGGLMVFEESASVDARSYSSLSPIDRASVIRQRRRNADRASLDAIADLNI